MLKYLKKYLGNNFIYRARGIMSRVRHYGKISLLVFILLLQGILVRSGLADCEVNGVSATNGTAGDDVIVCDDNPSPPTTTAVGGGSGGNDTIIINNDNAATVTGDGDVVSAIAINQVAVAGEDTIIINATTSAVVLGDAMLPGYSGADDAITINGKAYLVYGDYVSGTASGGDDTITINGTLDSWVLGDYQWAGSAGDKFTGGNDTIIVNGTIRSGGVRGDLARGTGTSIGGGDTIIISGTAIVNGVVEGDTDVTVGGNDSITIEVGATITGTISGGNVAGDFDILTFTGSTSDQAGYAQLQALVGCNPCSGTVTIDGYTYTFTNFEQFVNLMTLVVASSGAQVVITFNPPPDDRINWQEGDWLTPIYNHNGDVRGILALGSADDLWIPETDLPTGIPAENRLVGCNESNTLCLYRLAGNGHWQVNANLVVDGLPQLVTVIFDSLDPTTVTSH
jgi:hypothetical protein